MTTQTSHLVRRHVHIGWMPAYKPALLILLGAVALALPFFLKNFTVFQIALCFVYAIAVLGLNLLIGYSGQVSIGHGAFYAVGAYIAAILVSKFGVPYWATIPIAAILCFVVGFLFGFPALRLEGHYLALATLALAIALPQVLKHAQLESWTGGVQGIIIPKPVPPIDLPFSGRYDLPLGLVFDFKLTPDRWLYFFCGSVAVILFLVAQNLVAGRIGRALLALRDHPVAAKAMGVNTARYKSLTFGISSMYTGIAGALSAVAVQYVAPDSFTFLLSLSLIVGCVIGGVTSIWGAVFGGVFIQFVPNVADELSKAAPWAVYGVILILAMYVLPEGVAGLISSVRQRLAGRFGHALAGPAPKPALDEI
ncbi:branched-chain amino acid ABC transporter permease [Bradyrhizobium sp. AUGA SZCCT0431]|uniref:branched-chain amino acid ABC transporter permease n=1 Tax=Bradyrhizobium sp. AUGA SZCCT0431 TaxID=2807674 RepID=UPI001BA89545|nr:branched-chain amino acid ABC transporter permease [Bradyrhizobium sp. AUGA SZCCT0431]MBR1146182.1 branched-chain amino acid ABC transporter permease [Bradyrhizobium sp. AUGA SZCCT0431]